MALSAAKSDQTLSQSLCIQIEREIVEGKLLPGDKLDEEVLAARLKASRTPVREALRALASVFSLGLVRP
jgi:DNA-binding GntR family transcriptional regulator